MSAEGESSIPKGKFQHIIKIQIKQALLHFEINVKRYIIICRQPSRFLPQKEKGLRRGYEMAEGCENQVDLQDLHHSLEKNTTQQMMKENEKSMDLKIVRIKVEEVTVISK